MAGKTFPGIGDLEDESPPVEPADAADSGGGDSRPFYSGPTVVDDLKVEEGLKKLRSLDVPLGPLTGITKAVVDAIESEPARVAPQIPGEFGPPSLPSELVAHQMRETAVGRNVVGPTVGQQEIPPPFDDRALRGTMFGHSIHAPEFALPSPEEPPAPGALALLNRGAPTKTVAIFPPNPGEPTEAEPFQRSSRYRSTPFTPMDVSNALPSRSKLVMRVAIGIAGIVAIVAVALIWTRAGDDPDDSARATAARKPAAASAPGAATAPPAVANSATPSPTARQAEPQPIPAVEPTLPTLPTLPGVPESPPVGRSSARSVARHTGEPSDLDGSTGPAARPHHVHSAPSRSERRHDATNKETGVRDENPGNDTPSAGPAKPARSVKHGAEDDPDATMAPSIE